jgi:DNA excision repair protein ERCC-1
MEDDDDYGTDADFLAALVASEASTSRKSIQQPTPQKIDKPTDPSLRTPDSKVVQPTPQALPTLLDPCVPAPERKSDPYTSPITAMGIL